MVDQVLAGRVAFVTGAGSGIGAACATALAEAGADVAMMVHDDPETSKATVQSVKDAGRKVQVVTGDVGDEGDVAKAFDKAGMELGVPDILVNSAGLNMSGVNVADMELEQWNRLIGADLTGSFLTSRRFVRDLRAEKKPGAIIHITSIHAFAMRAGGADYDAAKGGQTNLMKTLAIETASLGITVNAIAPGMILTPMNEKAMDDPKYRKSLEKNIPAGRAGRPEEVARAAVYLASKDGAYITGATLTIDGGLSLLVGLGA